MSPNAAGQAKAEREGDKLFFLLLPFFKKGKIPFFFLLLFLEGSFDSGFKITRHKTKFMSM